METSPSIKELHEAQMDYHLAHPGYFRFGGIFRTQGIRLPNSLLPDTAQVKSAHKALPDLFNMAGPTVSERVMLAIEALEPGVHQFKEVFIRLKNKTPAPGRYYAMVIMHTALDQVDLERTTSGPTTLEVRAKIDQPRDGDDGKIWIDRLNTAGWHVRLSEDIWGLTTLSNELKEKFDEMGVDCNRYIFINEEQR